MFRSGCVDSADELDGLDAAKEFYVREPLSEGNDE